MECFFCENQIAENRCTEHLQEMNKHAHELFAGYKSPSARRGGGREIQTNGHKSYYSTEYYSADYYYTER